MAKDVVLQFPGECIRVNLTFALYELKKDNVMIRYDCKFSTGGFFPGKTIKPSDISYEILKFLGKKRYEKITVGTCQPGTGEGYTSSRVSRSVLDEIAEKISGNALEVKIAEEDICYN